MSLATLIDESGRQLGAFLPRLGGALVLLIVGLILARLVGRFVGRLLERVGLDRFAERWRVNDVIGDAGLGRSLSRLTGRAIGIALSFVVVFAALSLLGLQFLSESLNQGVLFLPKLLVALALLLVGVVLAAATRERVDRLTEQMDVPLPLGRVAQFVVLAIFAITAAAQVAVSTAILMSLVGILLAGVAATFALAFGLGGRDLARQMSAGRYVSGAFELGQRISVGERSGEIVALEGAVVVLRVEDGAQLRVPNSMLLDEVVRVEAG